MNHRFILTALFFLSAPAYGQEKPALPRPVSPEIHADKTVTFRLRAPEARKVEVRGDWGGEGGPMAKGADGWWSLTLGPLSPDIYSYNFAMDGVNLLDPLNPLAKPKRSKTDSVLDLPRDIPAAWDQQPGVARGTVHLHQYTSKSLGSERQLRVYTPPNYDAGKDERYPVLYLLHGSGDNEATWTEFGRAHVILDNLIAAKKAVPMVVVMTDGHAVQSMDPNARRDNASAFERDLLEDVLPLVESRYRIGTEPARRAISGLSMGGNQTLIIGLNHPDLFAWIGGMSSALREPERVLAPFLADPKASAAKLKLLWFACGKEDFLLKENQALHKLLDDQGVAHEWHETEGGHKWGVWRRYLADLAPRLFQPGP